MATPQEVRLCSWLRLCVQIFTVRPGGKMIHTSAFRSRKKELGKVRERGLDWFDADNGKLWSPAARLHWATDELFPSS